MPFISTMIANAAISSGGVSGAFSGAMATAATVASVGVGTYSAVAGAQAAKDQASMQRSLARYDQKVKEDEARQRREIGAIKANERRKDIRRMLSSQRADYAKAGVTTAGSPLLVMSKTAEIGELDALTEAYNAEIGAEQSLSAAERYRQEGKTATRVGKLRSRQSLISGAAGGASLLANYYSRA